MKLQKSNNNDEHREDDSYIGTHILADFWDCEIQDGAENLLNIAINAAHISNATILDTSSRQFDPEGATVLILLAESHISIHTWPEYKYVAIDVFTCGKTMRPDDAIDFFRASLKPQSENVVVTRRGKNE